MARIAFIGLGAMGEPMAVNLARSGHEVRGFDLAPALCEKAAMRGVAIAASARETLPGAAVVVTMLQTGEQALSVWSELLPYAETGALFIDCSTIDIGSARRAHELARGAGVLSVDAPVSGGVLGARAGTLTFMCGAEAPALAAATPYLEKMGAKIIHCGGAGLGQAAKICNNMMLGAAMIATSEAFVLAEKLGLSDQALFDVASVSSGQSWTLTHYCPVAGLVPTSPANNGYAPGFMAALMLKDLKLALLAAADAKVATPLAAAAEQLYAQYCAKGGGATDFSGVINMIRSESEGR